MSRLISPDSDSTRRVARTELDGEGGRSFRGIPSLSETKELWQSMKGGVVTVDIERAADLCFLADAPDDEVGHYVTFPVGSKAWSTLGSVKVFIKDRNVSIEGEDYDFDQHKYIDAKDLDGLLHNAKEALRNLVTAAGELYHGAGRIFKIKFVNDFDLRLCEPEKDVHEASPEILQP